jgi:hypothetical protein
MKNLSRMILWARLAEIVRDESTGLPVTVDEPGDLRIETEAGRPFASVRIQLHHVGVYLLPLYYYPDMLPASLGSRKSGAVTLRFTNEEDAMIGDLGTLIERCLSTIGNY